MSPSSAESEKHLQPKDEKPMPRGEFKLIIGNMFGNKTGRLMLEIETLRQFGRKRILIFKPDIDTRSDQGYIKDYRVVEGRIVEDDPFTSPDLAQQLSPLLPTPPA